MGATTNYGFVYPEVNDNPGGLPGQLQTFAAAVDTRIKTVADSVPAGGGGGGSTPAATLWAGWQAASAQPIATATDVTVAFGTALSGGDSAITRATSGAGHSFTLGAAKLWTVTLTARFAVNGTGGRTFEIRAGSAVLAKVGDGASPSNAWTANLSITRRLPAGTVITAVARQDSGSSLALEHSGGDWVHIDFAGI